LGAAAFEGPLREELNKVDPKLLYAAIRAVSTNPSGWARAQLQHFFQNQLNEDHAIALAPVILAAVESPSPADAMFSSVIREEAFKALTKYYFVEGIEAGVEFAKTQGGHASESRTGEIMKELVKYGSAAKPQIPALRKLIASLNAEVEHGEFPGGELNNMRVTSVEEAIKSIEAATTHPELRSIKPK
jgi:hypothetical protein